MHQDDTLEPQALERQVKVLDDHARLGLVLSDYCLMNRWSVPLLLRTKLFDRPGLVGRRQILSRFLDEKIRNFIGGPPVLMFRRRVLEKTGFFDAGVAIHNDIEFCIRINMHFECFYLDDVLSHIRIHRYQLTQQYLRRPWVILLDRWRLLRALMSYPGLGFVLKSRLFAGFLNRIPRYLEKHLASFFL